MSTSGPGDEEQKPPQWQQPQWKSGDPLDQPSEGQPEQPSWQQQPQDQPSWQQQQPQWQQPQDQPMWQQSQPQWGGQQQQWGAAPQTPGSATAALILGICSLLVCAPICGPLAIVYGNKAKSEINASNGSMTGGGMATAGVVMGWIAVALTVIGVLGLVALIAANS